MDVPGISEEIRINDHKSRNEVASNPIKPDTLLSEILLQCFNKQPPMAGYRKLEPAQNGVEKIEQWYPPKSDRRREPESCSWSPCHEQQFDLCLR